MRNLAEEYISRRTCRNGFFFQGLVITLPYCFMNTEVRTILKQRFERWKTSRVVGNNNPGGLNLPTANVTRLNSVLTFDLGYSHTFVLVFIFRHRDIQSLYYRLMLFMIYNY